MRDRLIQVINLSIHVFPFGAEHMLSDVLNGAFQIAAARAQTGRLYFTHRNGLLQSPVHDCIPVTSGLRHQLGVS